MTTFNGKLTSSAVAPSNIPSGLSISLGLLNRLDVSNTVVPSTLVKSQSKTSGNGATSPVGVTKNGKRMLTFVDDYYYRFHISPSKIYAGNLVGAITKKVAIWNAYFDNKSLNSIVASGTQGLNLIGLSTFPTNYKPLEYVEYDLSIGLNGPSALDASYLFTFNSGQVLNLTVSGSRVLIWPFPPNWVDVFTEILEWKTDVLTAYSGVEQRRELRTIPRRYFEYSFQLKNLDARKIENLLFGWQSRNFAMPVWTDRSRLTSEVSIGDSSLFLPTDTYGFSSGGLAILFQDSENYESVTIDTISNDHLTLKYPTTKAWHIGTKVYPVVVGHLATSVSVQRYTNSLLRGKVNLMVSPSDTYANLPIASAAVIYDGLEVITQHPNWKEPIDNEFIREFTVADSGIGAVAYFDKEKTNKIVRPFAWLLKNRSSMVAFRKMLLRLRGQAKTCWIPSWHDDFTVTGITPNLSASLTVGGTEFANLVGVNTSRDRIMVVLNDGSVYYRKINNITIDGNNTVLGLDQHFSRSISPIDVKSIYLLLRCRLASDKVEIPWRTDGVADPQLTFVTVIT